MAIPSAPSATRTTAPAHRAHVLLLLDRLGGGGAERIATGLAIGLDKRRFDVSIAATRAGSWNAEATRLRASGVQVLELRRRSRADLGSWRPLLRQLSRRRPDILHGHMHGSNIWAGLLGTAFRVPVVIATEHSWSFQGHPLRVLRDRFLVGPLADQVVAVSEVDRMRMITKEHLSAEKIAVIPTGLVPRDEAEHPPAQISRELGLPAGAPLVATVAQMRPEKNLGLLLDAFAKVDPRFGAHLLLAGDGVERARLQERARELGLEGRAHFLGFRHDVPAILSDADIFAMSSDNEGSPLALIEAMHGACAIVATEVGGVPAIAPSDVASILVPRRDAERMSEAISLLLADPALRERLGRGAQARAEAHYGFQTVVRAWEQLYERLLERRAGLRLPH